MYTCTLRCIRYVPIALPIATPTDKSGVVPKTDEPGAYVFFVFEKRRRGRERRREIYGEEKRKKGDE